MKGLMMRMPTMLRPDDGSVLKPDDGGDSLSGCKEVHGVKFDGKCLRIGG